MRVLSAFSLLALLVAGPQAEAATFQVDSTTDAVDADPGDGVCATLDGECTLRAAVMEANALPGFDVILLEGEDYQLTLPGPLLPGCCSGFIEEEDASVGDLDLLDDVLIASPMLTDNPWPGAAADGARVLSVVVSSFITRAFEVGLDVNAQMRGLIIEQPPGLYGSVVGGGILNLGRLDLDSMSIQDNKGGIFGSGGGIFNAGVLEIRDSRLSGNRTRTSGRGGAIHNAGPLTIVNSVLEHNVSENAGALWSPLWSSAAATVVIVDTTIMGNGGGGAIQSSGSLSIYGSTIASNLNGQGALAPVSHSGGELVVVNSTISSNESDIFGGISASAPFRLIDSTLVRNVSTRTIGGVSGTGAAVAGTIIAENVGLRRDPSQSPDCRGTFASEGHNLVGIVSTFCSGFEHPTDQVGTPSEPLDPQLGPLADNGGPTLTHMPLPGSPAIDADPDCPPGKDQRGVPRPLDGDGDGIAACDIGAVEFGALAEIDIKPGSDPNPINLMSNGVIPVAIFGSETFDVRDVDVETLAFGPRGAAPFHKKGGHRSDVDGDGFDDLVSHYETDETGIGLRDYEACVTGKTFYGVPFGGCDGVMPLGIGCGLGFELVFVLPPLLWLRRRRQALG